MVDARIDEDLVFLVVGLQRLLESRNAGIHALVEPGIVQQQRRLDLRHVGSRRLRAVIGDGSLQVRRLHGDPVDHAAAPAEADRAGLAVTARRLPEDAQGRFDVMRGLIRVQLGDHVAGLVLVGRRAAIRRQQIDRVGCEAFESEPAHNVLDVRIEAAVLVNDDHRGVLRIAFGARHVGGDVRRRSVEVDGVGDEARVVRRHSVGAGVIVLQERQQRQRRGGRPGNRTQPFEELAAVEPAMCKFVVEVDDALVHAGLSNHLPISPAAHSRLPRAEGA